MTRPHPILAAQSWLRAPATLAVMAALAEAGGDDCARFVGGCVRNALTGHPVEDIDIATRLKPDQVITALEQAGLKAVPTGVDHGTVTAVAQGQPFEITTLRRDVATDGRRAVVAFTDDWLQDAQRRDFRLNALYADAVGVLFDPTGEGLADALAGRIVFVGDAETRIAEDALRILRFFRFQAWYGRRAPDAAALAACEAMKAMIGRLSAERISKELLRLLAAPDPRAVVAAMAKTGVLGEVLPESDSQTSIALIPAKAGIQLHPPKSKLYDLDPRLRGDEREIGEESGLMQVGVRLTRLDHLVALDAAQAAPPDPLLRLAALLPDDGAAAEALAARLRLSNAQRDRLVAALTTDAAITPTMTPPEARAAIYRLGAGVFRDRVWLAWAADPEAGAHWLALLALARNWVAPTFPLNGDDALAAGIAAGPRLGEALRAVEAHWIASDFTEDRGALLARLGALDRP